MLTIYEILNDRKIQHFLSNILPVYKSCILSDLIFKFRYNTVIIN